MVLANPTNLQFHLVPLTQSYRKCVRDHDEHLLLPNVACIS